VAGESTGQLIRVSERVGKRILIADDAAGSRELVRYILERCGHEVIEAGDGEEALTKAEMCGPDLVILDLQMPRVDGYTVASTLRRKAKFAKTPILALSAAISQDAPERLAAAGFSSYLIKPIGPARLRHSVTTLLNRAAT
jgi:CheY-like chemotaxis protein